MKTTVDRVAIQSRRIARGISLIEALVALVVVAVGMLALAQVQVQLRLNAEVTRQRAEAVRFAQEDMERWRSFSKLAGTVEGAYAFIASAGKASVSGQENVNTVFSLTRSVQDVPEPGYKAMTVDVEWTARNGQDYKVTLNSAIGRIDPTMQAQLNNPPSDSAIRSPFNRNIRIPTTAVDLGGGKSGFVPPGQSTGYYVFNNTDATTIEYCTGSLTKSNYDAIKNNTSTETCEGRSGYFYSGFINVDLRNSISVISPGSTACNLYEDMQNGGFLATQPSLAAASVVLDRASLKSPRAEGAKPREYFTNAIVLSSPNVLNYGVSISQSGDLVVTLASTTVANPDVTHFSSTSPIVLRVKGGSTVETFIPTGTTTTSTSVTRSGSGTVLNSVLAINNKRAYLTLDPTANLAANTVYELEIPVSSVTLKKGTATDTNSGPVLLTFTTGTAAQLVSTSPANGATIANVSDNISLTFDRTVLAGAGIVTLYKKGNGNSFAPIETFNVASGQGGSGGSITFSGNTVTINPGADLVNGATYAIGIENTAVKDSNGFYFPGILNTSTYNFDTPAASVSTNCPSSAGSVLNFLEVQFTNLTSTVSTAQSVCYSDAATAVATGAATIGYFCVVYLQTNTITPFQWSGVPKLFGPAGWLSGGSARYKVCRYHDLDNNGTDLFYEHPATYSGVGESITDQNFLIIKNTRSCPNDTLNVGSQTGVVVYYNTAQFQP